MQLLALGALIVAAAAQTSDNTTSCPLQFTSACASSTQCGKLNGFQLECQAYGAVKQCRCSKADANCQNATNIPDTVPQFGLCTGGKQCADTGFKALDTPVRVCSEPLACVPQITAGNEVQSICHTCSSCKQQNKPDSTGKLVFNCTAICPAGQGDPVITIAPTTSPTTGSKNKTASGSNAAGDTGTNKPSGASKIFAGAASLVCVGLSMLL
ncbi:hypothetical protein SPRG_17095 [Saprolegnia parasitica CBS 223.65]|uniref:Secreted protein n=1 Tax=Saprolegnia parasitica (strain CBS 223.65) TaxID=695850 RepID=A0A067BGF4_SAPPC|nr:hypothetical protein SPRG_17095 [Saprolegnia parasitica CBS 223.65]KDO17489.1 hypothetical protein SPRG_17095 [Saprolegnia parasitica CBS 223.65]|eukprot:XP_012211806.1 hypothetical protein SPRG_17095 [Saprolegnia parasitica CBS 223.65]